MSVTGASALEGALEPAQARTRLGRVAREVVRGVAQVLRLIRDVLVICVPALSVAVSHSNVLSGSPRTSDVVAGTALAVIVAVMLLLRRRWPLAVTVVAAALYVVSGSVVVAVLMALVSLAVRSSWQRVAIGAGLVLTVFLVRQTRYGTDLETLWQQPGGVVVGVLGIASVASCGLYVGARRQLLVQALERARRVEAEQGLRDERARVRERTRIAREMHDVLAHRLSMLSLHAGALEYRADIAGGEVVEAAAVVRANAHEALQDLRDVLGVLRADTQILPEQATSPDPAGTSSRYDPRAAASNGDTGTHDTRTPDADTHDADTPGVGTYDDVVGARGGYVTDGAVDVAVDVASDVAVDDGNDDGDEGPLARGLRPPPTLRDLSALVDEVSALGAPVTLSVSGAAGDSTAAVQRAVYRVVQEGLTNAGKHAPGAPVSVEVAVEGTQVHVVVQNQAAPSPRPVVTPLTLEGAGSGLVGVVERVTLLGGWVQQGPCAGGGWALRVSIPQVPTACGRSGSAEDGDNT